MATKKKKAKSKSKAAPKKKKPPVAKAKAKAAPKKKTKAAPKKAKTVAPKKAKAAAPIRRRDGAGHLDPKYAKELRALGGHEDAGDTTAFVQRPRSKDDLAEELGEEFVMTATSGEDEGEDVANQDVPEEIGGPFVVTDADTEFAEGTDASNPKGAKREPFPRT
jgi:hypothetical protein